MEAARATEGATMKIAKGQTCSNLLHATSSDVPHLPPEVIEPSSQREPIRLKSYFSRFMMRSLDLHDNAHIGDGSVYYKSDYLVYVLLFLVPSLLLSHSHTPMPLNNLTTSYHHVHK